jgi:hypothetical protein
MLTPNNVTMIIGWFNVMQKNDVVDINQGDVDLLTQLVELLKDVEGREGEDFVTYKEYYSYLKNTFIPEMQSRV